MTTQLRPSVAVAENNILILKGICSLLSDEGLDMSLQASESSELIHQLENMTVIPAVCILDVNILLADDFETLKIIAERWPSIGILIFATHFSEHILVKILAYGAKGYILKNSAVAEIAKAIGDIYTLGAYHSNWQMDYAKSPKNKLNAKKYSLREIEVIFLKYCCTELTYKEIAGKMKITIHQIDHYRNELFIKLNIRSRVGLVLYAINSGIVNAFQTAS